MECMYATRIKFDNLQQRRSQRTLLPIISETLPPFIGARLNPYQANFPAAVCSLGSIPAHSRAQALCLSRAGTAGAKSASQLSFACMGRI